MTLGRIITCYSYKGGTGRSFTLANLATLLAQWGYKVLCVDWDLEAPGLSYYFKAEESAKGLLEMIDMASKGGPVSASDNIQTVRVKQGLYIDLITAGARDSTYSKRVQSLDWEHMYSHNQLGTILEDWRNDWMRRYDVVLLDSRTGITDIGGICTAQMPDVLLLFFTANQQSVDGVLDVLDQAISTRNHLIFDRPRLLAVPVPSRFDQGVEYERSEKWREIFQSRFARCYRDWVSQGVPLEIIMGHTIITYSPYWSFGEELPVLTENSREPSYVSYKLATLAALIAHRFENTELLADSRDSYVDGAIRAGHQRGGFRNDLYLSYTPDTASAAETIRQILAQNGLRIAATEHVPGGRWTDDFRQALDDSRNLVLLLGETPAKWQEREVEYVLRQILDENSSRRVIPVITNPAAFETMPPILKSFQIFNAYSKSSTQAAHEIIRSLEDLG